MSINKAKLTETDIITKFIMPAIVSAGWDDMTQIRQEVKLLEGKVIVRGQLGIRKNRIVAEVGELIALCNQLKARLTDVQTTQLRLTDAIVEQAV